MPDNTSLILLVGPESFIIEEQIDTIRAKNQGAERMSFGSGERIDWALLEGINREIPMLAAKRLIEVRLDSTKLDKKSLVYLEAILNDPSPDCVFVFIVISALSKAEKNSAWYKSLLQKAAVHEHRKLEGETFTRWIAQRFKQKGIQCEFEAEVLLSHHLEGNLVAAAQQIELLGEVAKNGKISVKDVEQSVVESNQFGSFALNDALLSGDAPRATRILRQMRNDGVTVIQINSTIVRELSAAYDVARAQSNIEKSKAVSQRLRLWPRRQNQLLGLAKRLGRAGIDIALKKAARIDKGVKGRLMDANFDEWDEIQQLLLVACGVNVKLNPQGFE